MLNNNTFRPIKNYREKGKYFIIFLFLVIAPIFFTELIIDPTNLPRFIYTSIILFLFLLSLLIKKKEIIFPKKLGYLFLIFYLINLLSITKAINIADAIYESQKVFIASLTIICFITQLQNKAHLLNIIKSLILISFISIFYLSYEMINIGGFSVEQTYKVKSFFDHKNLYASYLFLSLVFPIYGFVLFNKKWKTIAIINIITILFSILIIQNRTVYIALIFTFCFFCLTQFKLNKKHLLILLPIIVIACFQVEQQGLISMSTDSIIERLQIWRNTNQLISDNPILGVGAGNWQYNFTKYSISDIYKISIYNTTFQKPHNDFLWILSELGILGFSIILFFILYFSIKSFPKIFKEKKKEVIILFSFLVGSMVIHFFSFPKERVIHLFLIVLVISFLIIDLNLPLKKNKSKVLIITLMTINVFNIVLGGYRLKGQYYTKILLKEKSKNNPLQVIALGKKAKSFFYKTDPTSTPIDSYIGWAYNTTGNRDSLYYHSKEAYEISPYDFEVLTNYGYALTQVLKFEEARKVLLTSYDINDHFQSTLLNLVVVEYNASNYKEALKWLKLLPYYETDYSIYLERINEHLNQETKN